MEFRRVEICGNIASGKTTLAMLMRDQGWHVNLENFQVNPFYAEFYKNPALNSFETELTFHLQHYHSIKIRCHSSKIPVVCDFSLTLDRAYADVTLKEKRHSLFRQISEELEAEIGSPTKIIRLCCPEEVLLERITARNREPEKSITIDYLKSLTAAIEKQISELSSNLPNIKIINIDSHKYNFAGDLKARETVLSIIKNA